MSEGQIEARGDALLADLGAGRSFWLGAVSFEDRSLASLHFLKQQNIHIGKGIALDYEKDEGKKQPGRLRRRENWRDLSEVSPLVFSEDVRRRPVDPYVFDHLRQVLEDIFEKEQFDCLVIDISCLTTIHTLAVGAVIAAARGQKECLLMHTSPANYGFIDEDHLEQAAWKDILIAPLAETAELFYESHGRGIVLLGPEVERLIVGISEIEPAGGLVVTPRFEGRPDLSYFVKRRNRKIVKQLGSLPVKAWRECAIGASDLVDLGKHVREEVERASKKNAPAILFPFGPKPFTVASAYLMARDYPESAWFVYPIPASYDTDVTYGVGEILAFRLTEL